MVDLSHVPNVTTPIGLAGLAVVCLTYIILFAIRSRRKTIGLLPDQERTRVVDKRLTRYGIQLSDLPPEKREGLVKFELREIARSRLKIQRYLAILAAVVLMAALVSLVFVLVHSPVSKTVVEPPAPDPNDRVRYLKAQIMDLRGNIEAKSRFPETDLRQRGLQLADLIGDIDEDKLTLAARIIKHEYRGWALVMGVSTFAEKPPEYIGAEARVDHAQQAVDEFNEALRLMAKVTSDYRANDPTATDLYEWITGNSADLDRTHYLKAVALAVIARADDGNPRSALKELAEIRPTYLATFPAKNNPDLAWVLQQSSEASASRGPK